MIGKSDSDPPDYGRVSPQRLSDVIVICYCVPQATQLVGWGSECKLTQLLCNATYRTSYEMINLLSFFIPGQRYAFD